MSQLNFEHLDHAFDAGAGLNQPSPGKATLTSRLARPAAPEAGSIDAGSHASLEGGLGIELSRPARGYGGGDDGDSGAPRGGGARRGLSFLGGGVDVGPDTSRGPAAAPAGRGLEYLGDVESTGFSVAAKLDGSPAARPGDHAVHALATASAGGGEALPAGLRGSLESATGAGLDGVRVHTDDHAQTAASSINARAFARGQDIHFASGQYDPASAGGQHLIAHEVAHTIQQSPAPRAKADGPSVSSPTDGFEIEADRFADAFVGGKTAPISTGASQTTAFRAPDPAPVAPPPGKEGARGPDGRREFPKNAGPPPASMAYSVKPPTVPVKPGEPGPNVKQPPGGPPLPAQPLTAKGAPKGDAKEGDDKKPTDGKEAKGKGKGEGKGDDAAAAKAPKAPPGPPPAAPPKTALIPTVMPVQSVVMDDPGAITEHEIKQWTTKTGRGPADHRAEIEAVLSQLQSEITAKQQEIAALGKQLRGELEQANTQRVATFEGKVRAGSGTVSAAFDKITTGLTPLATKAKATVEQSRAEGAAKLKAAETTKGAELKAAFTAANTAVTNLSTQEAPAYEAIFGDFAKGLTAAGTFARGAADIESKAIVDKHHPEDCAGKSVPQARMTLEASLTQETAKTTTKDAKKKIDGIVSPAALDVQKNASGQVQALIKPYKDALDVEVKKTDTASKTNFAGAVKTAQDGLTEGAKEATAAIDKAVGTAKGNIAADKTTTMAMVEGAGKKAAGEVRHAGQEMASNIEERATKDGNEIGALMQEAKGFIQGKRVNADKAKPKLQDILEDAQALATAAGTGLRELLTKGSTDLEQVMVQQEANFTTAITEGNEQAAAADTKIQKEITQGAEDFAAGHAKLVQGFDDTVNKDIAKVTAATGSFSATATAGLKAQEAQVRNRMMMVVLPDAQKQLTEIAKSIPTLAGKTAGEQIEAKSKGASGKASKLRSAMDGWGTDENQIYGQLRDAGYGEIELIEATYDEHYAHRAGKGMSPLRYDLWDEMSGNELKIAEAYLDHQRDIAIKLELQDCCGWNDDEDRIEQILRSASDEELKTLASKEKATIDLVRDNMGGCDLDTVDALLDTDMDRDRRLRKADAIRVFDAMEGCGTDEAKIKALLEACTDEKQRQMLREEFNAYTKNKPGWGATAKRDKNGKIETDPKTGEVIMMDRLDSAIADDFSGHEANLVHALAEEKRDDFKIRAAKALYGGEGAGTDEHLMFEALDDAEYAKKYNDPKTPEDEKKRMRDERKAALDQRVTGMSGYETMDALLDNDMGERGSVTYDEIEKGQTKTGEKINSSHRARVNLEREVAQAKMERGACPPSLQIRYSCKGNGTDEKLIKDALSPGGNPMAKGEVANLCAKYEADWGRTLASFNELNVLDYVNFKGPDGDLDDELNGDDWFDVRMLLCGKPTTPQDLHYVSKARVAYKTGGVAGKAFMEDAESIGYTDTGKDLRAQEKRYDELYASLSPEERTMDLEKLALVMHTKRPAVNPDGTPSVYPKGHEKEGKPLPDDVFDRYSDYLQTDADAYGAAKASFVDALVTALEIIGGVLVTIATAGAASPVLAGIIANLIIAAGGIIIKRAALGDAYGADRFIEDAGMALLSAGVAVAEAKAFSKLATGAANKLVRLEAMKAAEEAGMEVVEEGVKIGAKGTRVLMNKALSAGLKTVMTESLTMVGQQMMTEEFWNGKLADTLLGENGLLAKLVMGVPKHMAAGMVRGAMEPFSTSRKSYPGSAFAQALTNVGANTAGILCYPDSYGDAQAFWDNMLTSNAQAFGRGMFDGVANHKARAANLGADFVHDRESPEELAPRAAYLSPDEMKTIAEAAAKGGKGHLLPEAFKKYLPATAPGDTTAPGAGGTDNTPPPPPPPPPVHDGPPKPPDNDNPPPLDGNAPVVKPADAPSMPPPADVAPIANPHDAVVDPNAPVTHVTDPNAQGAKPKNKLTPEELAADVQHRANEDRKNSITPEQRKTFDEIDGLATLAKTPADWEYIRDLEHKAGRPVSERHPAHDDAALLKSMANDTNYGQNADGTPKTKEQHDAAVDEINKDLVDPKVKAKAEAHDTAVKELTDETKAKIAKKDDAVKADLLAKAAAADVVDGPNGPRKEVTLDAAISLGMGGAGAAGAQGDLPGDHDSSKPRTDRIGIEDETRPELWGTLGNKPMGQEADAISYGTGGIKTSDVAEHATAQPAKASELALQVAAQRDASGVGTVGTQGPAGQLEFHEVTKPDGSVVLEVGIPMRVKTSKPGEPDKFETILVKTQQGVDISTGLGVSRDLNTKDSGDRKAQISEADALTLKNDIMSGDKALAQSADSFAGQRVLGIGGGPTSEWAMEHAKNGGATSAEVAGAMPRPKKGTPEAAALENVESQIRAIVDGGGKVPKGLTDQHHEIVTAHVQSQRARMDAIDAELGDGSTQVTPLQRERLQQERDKIVAAIDPFLGSRVDRNVKTLNNPDIKHVQADVMKVTPIDETLPDGTTRKAIEVTYADGTTRIVDKVIPSIGANSDVPGGINHMLMNAPESMKLIPVIHGGRCVGLESDPPGISISGAVLTGTLGHNMPPGLMARIPADMRDAVVSSLIDHASRDGVSAGSKGIIPGIENVGDSPELTQAMLKMSPEDRQKALDAFLTGHKTIRDGQFEGQDRFPELRDVKLPRKPAPGDPAPVTPAPVTPVDGGNPGNRSGARPVSPHPVGEDAGDASHRTAENSAHVTGRAKAAVDGMDDDTRNRYEDAHNSAENPAQKALIDRAVAAGHSMEDVHNLVNAMKGMGDADVLREFSGAGLVQFYHQSCVPTAYQIALAEMDPVFALKLRNNPDMMMQQQQDALVAGGGMQTPRRDGDKVPDNLKAQLDSGGGADAANDPTRYSNNGDLAGIETTSMIDGPLHQQLEKATGRKYVVATHEDGGFNTAGHETFGQGTVPHGKIAAAVDAGLPVIISHGGHAQVILGRSIAPDGTVIYIVTDPMHGKTIHVPARDLDVLPPGSVSMPVMDGAAVPVHPGHKPGTEVGEATGGRKKGSADPGGRGAWHLEDELTQNLPVAVRDDLERMQKGFPPSPEHLQELVNLRTLVAGGPLPADTGSPEHTLEAWNDYCDRHPEDTRQPFTRWMAGQPSRMQNNLKGPRREDAYRKALRREGVEGLQPTGKVVQSPSGKARQVDVMISPVADGDDSRIMIQVKAGPEHLSKSDRVSGKRGTPEKPAKSHSNDKALDIDAEFKNDRVIWVFEERASIPLVTKALASDVVVVQRVHSGYTEDDARRLMTRAGMSEDDIAKVRFVPGTPTDVVGAVVDLVQGLRPDEDDETESEED